MKPGIILNILLPAVIIAGTAVLAGFTYNALRQEGAISFNSDGNGSLISPIEMITLDQAINEFEQQTGLFIDTRTENEFAQGHIEGAINISYKTVEKSPELYSFDLPADKNLIIYCSGGDCDLSHGLATILTEKGFSNVQVFYGGWQEWFDSGFPVETGDVNPYLQQSSTKLLLFEIILSIVVLLFISIYLLFPQVSGINRLRRIITHPILLTCFRIILGLIFMYASIDKIFNPNEFKTIVHNYHILPEQLLPYFALVLPWIEFMAGMLLVVGIFVKGNALIITGMLTVFTIAVLSANIRGIDIACGCFSTTGAKSSKADWGLVFRDLAMIFFSLQLLLGGRSGFAIENLYLRRSNKTE